MLNLEEQIDVRGFFWFFMTCISLIGMEGRREGFVDEGVGGICSIVSLIEIEGDRCYGYLMPP
jgi:hypothetical protein